MEARWPMLASLKISNLRVWYSIFEVHFKKLNLNLVKRAHKPFGKWMTFNVLLRHLWLWVHCISEGRFACSDADFSLLTLLAGRIFPSPLVLNLLVFSRGAVSSSSCSLTIPFDVSSFRARISDHKYFYSSTTWQDTIDTDKIKIVSSFLSTGLRQNIT